MKDKQNREIKVGDIVIFMSGTSLWAVLFYQGICRWHVLDSYNFLRTTESIEYMITPMNLEIIGNIKDNPEKMFATYDKSRNSLLDYKIELRES